MVEKNSDLWPGNFEPAAIASPEEVMIEQAALLRTKTGESGVAAEVEDATEYGTGEFAKRFVITAFRLNYRYVLFRVTYPPTLYPAEVRDAPEFAFKGRMMPGWATPGSEEEFREVLA